MEITLNTVSEGIFQSFQKLLNLKLESNNIMSIENGTFNDYINVKYIHSNAFNGPNLVESFDLSYQSLITYKPKIRSDLA